MTERSATYDAYLADLSRLPFSFVYPERDSGVLFAFRMEEAAENSCRLRLTMLHPGHTYELRDADKGVLGPFKGSELAAGYTVTHRAPRSAALIYMRPMLTTRGSER